MDKVILQWNLYNWITVFLMAFIGMALVGAGASLYRTKIGGAMAGGSSANQG